jgi:hypothetical protein
MRKDQVDLQNAVVWIRTAEVLLSPLAIEAIKSQMAISGESLFLFRAIGFRAGTRRRLRLFGDELFDEQRFPTFGSTIFAPRTPQG